MLFYTGKLGYIKEKDTDLSIDVFIPNFAMPEIYYIFNTACTTALLTANKTFHSILFLVELTNFIGTAIILKFI